MALRQIREADLAGRGVMPLPDVPGLPAEEMKRKFEEVVREVVIPAVNENAANSYDKQEVAQKLEETVLAVGAADMQKAVYDPQKKEEDVYAYVEKTALTKAAYDPAAPGEDAGPVEQAGGIAAYAMARAAYDPLPQGAQRGEVAAAGGIPAYALSRAVYDPPAGETGPGPVERAGGIAAYVRGEMGAWIQYDLNHYGGNFSASSYTPPSFLYWNPATKEIELQAQGAFAASYPNGGVLFTLPPDIPRPGESFMLPGSVLGYTGTTPTSGTAVARLSIQPDGKVMLNTSTAGFTYYAVGLSGRYTLWYAMEAGRVLPDPNQ